MNLDSVNKYEININNIKGVIYNCDCTKGDTILDTFNGTGTTSIACVEKGFNFIGFEISKEQCEYAVDRINKNVIHKKPLRKVPKRA